MDVSNELGAPIGPHRPHIAPLPCIACACRLPAVVEPPGPYCKPMRWKTVARHEKKGRSKAINLVPEATAGNIKAPRGDQNKNLKNDFAQFALVCACGLGFSAHCQTRRQDRREARGGSTSQLKSIGKAMMRKLLSDFENRF